MGLRYQLLVLILCLQSLLYEFKTVTNDCTAEIIGEAMIFRDEEVCFQIIREISYWSEAVQNCNATGGQLMKMSDRHQLQKAVNGAVNISGTYWIHRSLDILIHIERSPWFRSQRTLENSCPWISIDNSESSKEVQFTVHLPSTDRSCFTTSHGYICKYDTSSLLTEEGGDKSTVLLVALIVVAALAVVLLGAVIVLIVQCRRRKKPKKSLYLAARTCERPEMYDAPMETQDSQLSKPLVYDIPLEDVDFMEQGTSESTSKKPKSRFHFFGSGKAQSAQVVVTNKKQRKGSEKEASSTKEMVEIRNKPKIVETETRDAGQGQEKTQRKSVIEDLRRSDLKVIERGKVGKVASLFEGPKGATDSNDKVRKTSSEERVEIKQTVTVSDDKNSPNSKKDQILTAEKEPKEEVKDKGKGDMKGNGDKGNPSGETVRKSGSPSGMSRNESDLQRKRRKEEERLKQAEIDKEIEKQRALANQKAHEVPEHVYMYVEEDDVKGNVNSENVDETYEPVLVYEN